MKKYLACTLPLIFFLLFTVSACKEVSYFPNKIFHDKQNVHDLVSNWYIKQLTALEETSIYRQSKNKNLMVYRFTWLRSFHNPISIRISVEKTGTGILIAKKASGTGGHDPGKIEKTIKRTMNKTEIERFINLIESEKFWTLASTIDTNGLDGAQWIVEGLSNGKYHLGQSWSPKKGSIRNIGMYLIGISGIEINSEELY